MRRAVVPVERATRVVPPDVHKGDRILFGKYAGSDVEIGGEEQPILRENDILGVVEK